MSRLANDLLVSIRPAPRLGPSTLKPAFRSASPTPASTAASGPRITRTSRSRLAKSECTHFHTSACSRAPEPTTRTFTAGLLDHLLPLDGAGRLACDVEDDPVDALDLVDDAVTNARQHLVGNARPIGGHGVLACHDAHCDDVGIGAIVAHHADGFERCQHGERLPH